MTRECYITMRDEVFCFITGLAPSDASFLWNKYGIYKDGYIFSPKYKLGQWDGRIRFFEKTGKTYIRLLEEIVPILDEMGYEIVLKDQRQTLIPEVGRLDEEWFARKGATFKGKPVLIRPYQVDAVNTLLETNDGFVIAGTGAGKSLMCAGLCDIFGESGLRTITVVPSSDLITQTFEWYQICKMDVGIYSGDTKDILHQHVVATWQALQNNPRIMQNFDVFIWDECFSGSTLILMGDLTWKRIEDIKTDDIVMSKNKNGNFEPKRVEKIHKNLKKSKKQKMLKLTFDNGVVIEVTENHYFYTQDGKKIMAKDLNETHELANFYK